MAAHLITRNSPRARPGCSVALGFGRRTLQACPLSSTALAPTDHSSRHPSMAVLGGPLLRQTRTVQDLGNSYLIRSCLSGAAAVTN